MSNSSSQPPGGESSTLRRFFTRHTLLAFVAGAALAAGVGASAIGMHHGMVASEKMTPAQVQSHVEHVLKHFYVEVDASEAQKAQIGPLVQQALSDLMPLHGQLRAGHEEALRALTRTPVDRASLESVRAQNLELADQASKRFVQLVADVDEVLTPTQRQAFVDHLSKMHAVHAP